MERDVDRILVSREQIMHRVAELGRRIASDYAGLVGEGGRGLVLVPVLTGSLIFVADLVRELPLKLRLRVVTIRSYPGKATRSQEPSIEGRLPDDLPGRHVLIVDDVLDSGKTLGLIRHEIESRSPASLRTCILLRKDTPAAMATPCEYIGFDIPDEFVVGYGLDYDDEYRNLPYIATLRSEVL